MTTQYQNPIRRGMYPDPSIVRVDDTYYMVNSTFEYYPGIALAKSQDLLNWEQMPGVAKLPSQADLRTSKSNEGIFAVCIRYHKGSFYVITTNFAEFKTFIIKGRFNDDHSAIIWNERRVEVNVPGIDPDLYFENNRTYVQFTGYIDDHGTKAIRQVEIDLATGKILDGPKILTYGTGGRDVEGPHILKKDGKYYLIVAEGGTGQGHMVTIFKSDQLWGPYTDEPGVNSLFTNRDRAEEPLQNIGHADLFTDPQGNWWLTCLGTRPATVDFSQITNIGRETLLYPVVWDGTWPRIYNGVPTLNVDLTDFPQHAATLTNAQPDSSLTDDFRCGLCNEWLTLRDTLEQDLTLQAGQLTLHGRNQRLSDLGTPAFLGLRQAEQEELLTIDLDAKQSQPAHGRYGLVTIINVDHFAGIMIQANPGGGYNVIRYQQVADVVVNDVIGHLDAQPAQLSIQSTKAKKIYTAANDEQTVSFTVAAINLSNEALAALNTGDIQGLYAENDAQVKAVKVIRKPWLPTEE